MGRPEQTAAMLREGRNPKEIASELRLTLGSVLSYLDTAVGRGYLRRSDIYFSFPPNLRQRYGSQLSPYSDARAALGDMYEDIRRIEVGLHSWVRSVLVQAFGDDEAGWWRRGVAESVRVKCQERREREVDEPCEPYCYTDLLDLAKIFEEQWNLFKADVPTPFRTNRKLLFEHLARLNRVRNKVMHPVRGVLPSEDDFDFVRRFGKELDLA